VTDHHLKTVDSQSQNLFLGIGISGYQIYSGGKNVIKIQFIMSQMWEFLKPFILVLMSKIGPALADAAMHAVTAAAASALDSSAKRDYAFDVIVEELKQQGIETATSVIYLAIETAVAKVKDSI
jgi:hypothetical protein